MCFWDFIPYIADSKPDSLEIVDIYQVAWYRLLYKNFILLYDVFSLLKSHVLHCIYKLHSRILLRVTDNNLFC